MKERVKKRPKVSPLGYFKLFGKTLVEVDNEVELSHEQMEELNKVMYIYNNFKSEIANKAKRKDNNQKIVHEEGKNKKLPNSINKQNDKEVFQTKTSKDRDDL